MYVRRGEERRREERAMGERRREEGDGRRGGREVERLLLSPSKSTVNNAGNYQGRHTQKRKTGETDFWRAREAGEGGGRRREREEQQEEGKHHSSVPSKHEMLGYFNKRPPFIWARKRESERERGSKNAGGKKTWIVKASRSR